MTGSPTPVRSAVPATLAQSLGGTASRTGQAGLPIRGENAKGGILKAPVQEGTYHFLVLFTLIGLKPNAHELPGGFNEFFLREQTVLRIGVARSEHARNPATGRRRGHEEDWTIGPPGLIQSSCPGRVPGDSGFADRLGAGSEVIGTGSSLAKEDSSGQAGDKKGAQGFHGRIND